MIIKNIKYTDYNGLEREEKFMFNLSKAELMEMEMGTTGGFVEMCQKIVETKDSPGLVNIFKDLILKSYGEKSADGRRFVKVDDNGVRLSLGFSQTEAYSELFTELATNDEKALEFIKGVIPSNLEEKKEEK